MKIASISPRKIWIIIICAIIAFSGHLSAQQDLKISSASSEIVSGSGSFDLGDVMPGSLGGYYFIVENVGDADLTFSLTSAVTFGGTNPGDFSTEGNLDDMTLAPGELDVFDVTFTPGTLGARSTVVTVGSDDPDASSYTFTVTVNSIASPASCILMTGDFENSYISSLPHLFEPGGITEFEAPSGWGSLTGTFLALFGADLNIGITADSRSGSGALELISNLDGLGDVVAIVPCTVGNQATLRGYYKYTGDPSENAVILISTSASNQSEQNTTSMIISSEALTYTFFEMDFPYYGDSEDQLLVQLFTTYNGGNATFILDDLEIVTTPVVAAPPGQPAPVTFTSPAPTSVTVNWTEPFDFGSPITGYSLEQKEDGGSYSEIYSGPNTTFDATGLTTGTTYFFQVKAINAEGGSSFSNQEAYMPTNTIFMSDGSISTCDAPFTDSGGAAGNYMDNENFELTISPDNPGDKIKVTFSSFALENSFDDLKVYDGPNTSSPLLQTLTGNSIPSDITSTATGGELTFVMESDGSGNEAGWEAMISCVTPGALPPEKPDAVTFSGLNATSVTVNWTAPSDNGSAITGYTLEQKAGIGGAYSPVYSGTNLFFNATGLTTGETYYYKVKATNANGDSDFSNEEDYTATNYIAIINGSENTCSAIFTDFGGLSNNYTNGENNIFTMVPDNPGGKIMVSFQSFSTESGFDELEIFDGPNTGSTSLGVFSGAGLPPDFTSTAPGGELTFQFISDGSVVFPGWEATISCSGALAPDKPDAPTFGTITTSSIVINWTAPDDNGEAITHYILEEKQGSGGTFAEIFNGDALTYTSTVLLPGSEYYYRVQAVNSNAPSLFSEESFTSTTTSVPDEPAGPTFGTITANSIVVNWTAPSDNGSAITGYSLEQKKGSGGTYTEVYSGTDLTFTSTSLDPGAEYYFKVKATNGVGDSPFSNESSTTTSSTAPDQPAAPTFGTVTSSSIVINWVAPNDNGSAITEYILQQKEGSGGVYATVSSGNTNLTYSATILNASTQYFYKVQAVNGIGNSSFSNEANTTTLDPPAAPDAPAAPTFGTVTSTSIVVNWTAPNDNGSAITEYVLKLKEGTGGVFTTVYSGTTDLTYTSTGLIAGNEYYYVVQAVNSVGSSLFSGEASITAGTPPDAPAVPTFGTITSFSMEIFWTAPNDNGSPITEYVLEQKEGSGGTFTTSLSGITGLQGTLSGLTPDTQYSYRLKAINASGSSPFSAEATATTFAANLPPNAPDPPTFGDITSTTIPVIWTAPSSNGSVITSYTLEIKEGLNGVYEEVVSGSTALTSTAIFLIPGTTYYFRVKAINANGSSPYSTESSATTPPAVPDQPAAPTFGTVTSSSIEVIWTAPNANGSPITEYVLEQMEGDGTFMVIYSGGTNLTFTSTNLIAGTQYVYKVKAINAAGSSPFSLIASTFTPSKQVQTIFISAIASKVYGDPDFSVSATASSGLPVTLTTTGPITLNGTTVSITGTGSASVIANQAGNDIYNPAPEAIMGFFVSTASQEITFTQEDVIYSDGLVIPLNAQASSGLPISYTFSGDGNSEIVDNDFFIASAHTYSVTASQSGNDNYFGAANVTVSFCVNPAQPVITANGLGTGNVSLQTDQGTFPHRWFLGGLEMFDGTLQSSLITIEEAGVYAVETEVTGCTSERSEDFALIVTDIEKDAGQQIKVYPNPVESTLNIQMDERNMQQVEIALHDLNGKYLLTPTSKNINGYMSLDVSELKSGFYILRMQTGKGISQIKFSKK